MPDPECAATIFAQDYDGAIDILFSRDNPFGQWTKDAYRNVQLNYEKMRQLVLANEYAAAWCVEADMLVPPDALAKLVAVSKEHNAPVVSGLYVLRHGANVPNLFQPGSGTNPGSAVQWSVLRQHLARGTTTVQVSGGCQGCVYLRRDVLQEFCFLRDHAAAPDLDLMRYCHARAILQLGCLDVQCGHKQSSGEILYPSQFLE
jgi:hypothetical protein